MQEVNSFGDLNEKSLEIILNFKSSASFENTVNSELSKLKEDIKKTIDTLPSREKEILMLRYFQGQGLTQDQISEKLLIPKYQVNQILLGGINLIKEKVKTGSPALDNKKFSGEAAQKNQGVQTGLFPVIASLFVFFIVFFCTLFVFQGHLLDKTPSFKNFVSIAGTSLKENLPTFAFFNVEKRKVNTTDVKKIRISGSTSLLLLAKRWQDAFSIEYPKYRLELVASDSDSGINSLINGQIEIANSSRPVTFLDQKSAGGKGIELSELRIALDALVVIVNSKNSVNELSLNDLKKIFAGEIKNWREISSYEEQIFPVVREQGSGTNDFVISRILDGNDFSELIPRKNTNPELIKFVSLNTGAVSFVNSINYPWDDLNIKYLKIKSFDDLTSFSPFEGRGLNETAIRYGDYPLSHYLYLVTVSNPPRGVQKFLKWVHSSKGQEVVKYSGLIPIQGKEES